MASPVIFRPKTSAFAVQTGRNADLPRRIAAFVAKLEDLLFEDGRMR